MSQRTTFFLVLFCLYPLLIFAQSDNETCNRILRDADALITKKNFRLALRKYNAVKICDPILTNVVDKRIVRVFEKMEQQRLWNERAKLKAQATEAQTQAALEMVKKEKARAEESVQLLIDAKNEADKNYRAALANDLAFKSQQSLREGDRTTAIRLAKYGLQYLDAQHVKLQKALQDAWHYNIIHKGEDSLSIFEVMKTLQHHRGIVQTLVTKNESLIISGSSDSTIKIWNTQKSEVMRSFTFRAKILDLQLSPNEQYMVISTADSIPVFWDITLDSLVYLVENEEKIHQVHVSNEHIATLATDGSLRVWSIESKGLLYQLAAPQFHKSATITPNGKQLITWGKNAWVYFWNITDGKAIKNFKAALPEIQALAMLGQRLGVVSTLKEQAIKYIQLWDLTTDQPIMTRAIESFNTHTPSKMVFAIDSLGVVCGGEQQLLVLNLNTGAEQLVINHPLLIDIDKIDISMDNQFILTTSAAAKTTHVWNLETGELVQTLQGILLNIPKTTQNPVFITTVWQDIIVNQLNKEVSLYGMRPKTVSNQAMDNQNATLNLYYQQMQRIFPLPIEQIGTYDLEWLMQENNYIRKAQPLELFYFAQYFIKKGNTLKEVTLFQKAYKKAEICLVTLRQRDAMPQLVQTHLNQLYHNWAKKLDGLDMKLKARRIKSRVVE